VRWATEEALYVGRHNGRRAAFVTANMKEGENIFAVQRALDARIEAFRKDSPRAWGSCSASSRRRTSPTA